MYVVTKNNPFYPDVAYCETIAQAEVRANEWLLEMSEPDGHHICQVTIAQVIRTTNVKSYY